MSTSEKIKELLSGTKVDDVDITTEVKTSFLDYALSVIVSRAIPDVRDGLKPVHRRIIYAMKGLGMTYEKPYKKSARVVGEVIGKYHPHGDSAVYESMVRMAQDFSYRHPLIDGHGNFGSLDGDSPAAMRYTEVRLSRLACEMVRDLEKETVPFVSNYDNSEREPRFLPAYFPNLLVNGTTGIAVGVATNLAPHNLGEVIDATIAYGENNDITVEGLLEYIKGPDFPTGALVTSGVKMINAYKEGHGSVTIRSKIDIETHGPKNDRKRIIVKEIPYMVNKAKLIEKIADLIKSKTITGISDIRDLSSNKGGVRIAIDLKKNVEEKIIKNNLYKLTPLQTNFSFNVVALHDNQPKVLSLHDLIKYYYEHNINMIIKRSQFELKKLKQRHLILEGLKIALANIDEVIKIIKNSATTQIANENLVKSFNLVPEQAKAILEMRLQRLTALEIEKINNEIKDIEKRISYLEEVLSSKELQNKILTNELLELKNTYDNPRRSTIIKFASTEINPEELVTKEDILVMLTKNNYIKRLSDEGFKLQKRGGKGIKSFNENTSEDKLSKIINMKTTDLVYFFTDQGKVYTLEAYKIETYSKQARGLPIINLIHINKDEKIVSINALSKEDMNKNFVFATEKGIVKKVSVQDFVKVPQTGKKATSLRDGDRLFGVTLSKENDQIILVNSKNKLVKFDESNLSLMGRTTIGVKGIQNDDSTLIGLVSAQNSEFLLSISEKGYAKKTFISEYKETNRGTKGVKAMNLTDKTGNLKTVKAVFGTEDVILTSHNGFILRISLEEIPESKRQTVGVKTIKVNDDDKVEILEVFNQHQKEQ